jgi:hypothetical protein
VISADSSIVRDSLHLLNYFSVILSFFVLEFLRYSLMKSWSRRSEALGRYSGFFLRSSLSRFLATSGISLIESSNCISPSLIFLKVYYSVYPKKGERK